MVWVKRVWRCPHALCPKRTWTETSSVIAPRASLTERARAEICRRVGQDGASVAAVARDFGIRWRTAMAAVVEHGTPRVDDLRRLDDVEAVRVDETAFAAASATRSTSFVTGIVDVTRRRGGSARLLERERRPQRLSAGELGEPARPGWRAGIEVAALDPYRGYASALRCPAPPECSTRSTSCGWGSLLLTRYASVSSASRPATAVAPATRSMASADCCAAPPTTTPSDPGRGC